MTDPDTGRLASFYPSPVRRVLSLAHLTVRTGVQTSDVILPGTHTYKQESLRPKLGQGQVEGALPPGSWRPPWGKLWELVTRMPLRESCEKGHLYGHAAWGQGRLSLGQWGRLGPKPRFLQSLYQHSGLVFPWPFRDISQMLL